MSSYTIKSTENRAYEGVGHRLAINFSPSNPEMKCPDHPGQYIDLQVEGSSLSGSIKDEPKLRFTATLTGKRVECSIIEDDGGANEVGSWTAEDDGDGGLGGGG